QRRLRLNRPRYAAIYWNLTAFEPRRISRWVQPVSATYSMRGALKGFPAMTRTGRPGLSSDQKAELWRRWKAGDTLSDIGRALGKHAASVFAVISGKGGFAPAQRSRRLGCLTRAEREDISRGLAEGR